MGKNLLKIQNYWMFSLNYINNPELHGDLMVRTASYSCSLLFYKCGLDENFTGCASNMMIQNYCSQILA